MSHDSIDYSNYTSNSEFQDDVVSNIQQFSIDKGSSSIVKLEPEISFKLEVTCHHGKSTIDPIKPSEESEALPWWFEAASIPVKSEFTEESKLGRKQKTSSSSLTPLDTSKIENTIPEYASGSSSINRSRTLSLDSKTLIRNASHTETFSNSSVIKNNSLVNSNTQISIKASSIALNSEWNSLDDFGDESELSNRIQSGVKKLRESSLYLPLLNDILGVRYPENELLAKLSNDGMRSALISFIVRLVNRASELLKVPIAFYLDDAQIKVARFSELGINTRLIRSFINEFDITTVGYFKSVLDFENVSSFTLSCLDFEALNEMIVSIFSDHQVEIVEPSLVAAIHQKTSGNCFVAEIFCETLLQMYENSISTTQSDSVKRGVFKASTNIQMKMQETQDFVIDRGILRIGNLQISKQSELLDQVLPSGAIYSAIVAQYDKLGSRFQRILAVASCLGQHFTLRSLWAVCIQDEDSSSLVGETSPQMFLALLKAEDKFGFLVFPGRSASPDEAVIGQRNIVSFRDTNSFNEALSTYNKLMKLMPNFHELEVSVDDTNGGFSIVIRKNIEKIMAEINFFMHNDEVC
ncbi:hypothetical protein HK096_005103 [Nowakowskiella sp. JEL0078]|nr:hypothetical protein HK096_005103 [Nowakowskiella sp. JEL0078]